MLCIAHYEAFTLNLCNQPGTSQHTSCKPLHFIVLLCTRFNLNLQFFLYARNWVSQCIRIIVWSRPRVLISQRDPQILSHNLGELPKTRSQWTGKLNETHWFINVKVGNLIGVHFLLASRLVKKFCLLKHHIGQNMKQEVRLCAIWPGRTWISSKFYIAIEPSPHPWSASSRVSLIKQVAPALSWTPPLVEEHPISGVDIFINFGSFPIANPPYANVPWIERGDRLPANPLYFWLPACETSSSSVPPQAWVGKSTWNLLSQ